MAAHTRRDLLNVDMGVDTTQLYPTSRLVSRITGMPIQPNKSVVGENAFRHASGIHQDGVLKERSTYELMDPVSIGWPGNSLVLGKLSGRAGLRSRLEALGYVLSREDLDQVFEAFKVLADKKQEVTDRDLEALMAEEKRVAVEPVTYTLDQVQFSVATATSPRPRCGSPVPTIKSTATRPQATARWMRSARPYSGPSGSPQSCRTSTSTRSLRDSTR